MKNTTFLPTDLLLPQNCNLTRWSVIASDQYISKEEYWQTVEDYVCRAPSALRLVLPESCLDGPNIETDIMSANGDMSEYLRGNIFKKYENSLVYVQRKLKNGQTRHGIVGMVDLELYDYDNQATTQVRATEQIHIPRIPPRVAVRKNAPLELSHVILMADDDHNLIFGHINTEKLEKIYDFELMQDGGQVTGWLLGKEESEKILEASGGFGQRESFEKKYQVNGDTPLLQFLVADGNHSLATAKECYERQKKFAHTEDWENLPARYAMVELVNLHDPAVELRSYHRVISGVDPQEFLRDFRVAVEKLPESDSQPQDFTCCFGGQTVTMTVKHPNSDMEITTLHSFLEEWVKSHSSASVEFILDRETALKSAEKSNTISIILPDLNKKKLFSTLLQQGILPQKSFSLGEPNDKRFYLEARKIR